MSIFQHPCPFVQHAEPDNAVIKRWDALQKLKRSMAERKYIAALRQLIASDPWFVARFVFDFHFMDEDLHSKLLLNFHCGNWNKDLFVFLPRGHGKTFFNYLIATSCIVNDPYMSILVAGESNDLAQSFADALARSWMTLPLLQEAFPDVFPSKPSETYKWSASQGYYCKRKGKAQRKEPSLFAKGIESSATGTHPELVLVDDVIGQSTNNEAGFQRCRNFLTELINLTQGNGAIKGIGTIWSDRSPYREIIDGNLIGGNGPYEVMIRSCYLDPETKTDVLYPRKQRPFSPSPAGFTTELLEGIRESNPRMFAFQYLNDATSQTISDIDIDNIQKFDRGIHQLPLSHIQAVVFEKNAGSNLIWSELNKSPVYNQMPLVVQPTPKVLKHDRILAILEPYFNNRRVYLPQGVDLGNRNDIESFLYQLANLRTARHDDMADALSMAVAYKETAVGSQYRWPIYIGIDCAFTEEARSDYSALVAVAVDHEDRLYPVAYHQFKADLLTEICTQIWQFYNRVRLLTSSDLPSAPSSPLLHQFTKIPSSHSGISNLSSRNRKHKPKYRYRPLS